MIIYLIIICCIISIIAAITVAVLYAKPAPPALIGGVLHGQGQCTSTACGGLVYMNNGTAPWNKYYKVSCVSPQGVESDPSPVFGPVAYGNYANPKIRMAENGTPPCGTNTVKVYRGDNATTMAAITPKNFAVTGPYDGKDAIFTDA